MSGGKADQPPWYIESFRAGYLELYPHRNLEAARAEVQFLASQGLCGRVLDLCCGFGRHSLALHERGLQVLGIDLSAELLAHAQLQPELAPIRDRLVRGDARAIPVRSGSMVLNLFSSFGYFGEGGDRLVLAEIARVLGPRGCLVLDLMNPQRVRQSLVPSSKSQRGDALLLETRWLAPDGATVFKDVEFHSPQGVQRWREEVRMYEPLELDALLLAAGFAVESRFGDFAASTFGADSPRQLVFARLR
jgi:SAM-dependent methyltransferase